MISDAELIEFLKELAQAYAMFGLPDHTEKFNIIIERLEEFEDLKFRMEGLEK